MSTVIALVTVIFWSLIVNLLPDSSASIWATSSASTLIVAPAANVIPVVEPPLIVS